MKYSTILKYISIFVSVIMMMVFAFLRENEYIFLGAILTNVIFIFVSIKNIPICLIGVFFLKYSFIPYYYFVEGVQISAYSRYFSVEAINLTSLLLAIFFTSILLTYRYSENKIEVLDYHGYECKHAFYIALLLFVISIHFGMSGDSILVGGYGSGGVSKSSLFEYGIIFFAIMLLTRNKSSNVENTLVLVLLVVYLGKSLIFGARIEMLQILLVYVYLTRNFLQSYSYLKIYIFGFIGFQFFELFGSIRSDPYLLNSILSLEFNDVFRSIFQPGTRNVLVNNASDVSYASYRILGMLSDGEISLSYRILSFASFLLNIPGMLFSSEFVSYQNLADYKSELFSVGGGGLIVAYTYVWLSFLGPIIFGLLIGAIFTKTHSTNNRYMFIYAVLVVISFPRWFAYGPITLVKFCVFGAVVYYALCNMSALLDLRKKNPYDK